jgi:excinuclease ABC subunit B
MPVTGVFIEKDLSINEELENATSTTASLLVTDICSICFVFVYGIGNPIEFQKNLIPIEKGTSYFSTKLLHQLVLKFVF